MPLKDLEARKAYDRARYHKDKEKAWRYSVINPARTKEKTWIYDKLYRYNLSKEEFDKLWEVQRGLCALCDKLLVKTKSGVHIDHSHKTEKVRGLLCITCNLILGILENRPTILLRVADYLKRGESI